MVNAKKVVLGISCGDINGVGIEIVIKTFSDNDLLSVCTPILYAPESAIYDYKKRYNEFKDFNYHIIKDAQKASPSKFNVISFFNDFIHFSPGSSNKQGAEIALKSLNLAIEDLKRNTINVLLTLPVNKHSISIIEKDFIGHTEHLSKACDNEDNLMLLCDDKLRIATLTNHLSISKVANSITKKLIKQKLNILIDTLNVDFAIDKPKIAVLSLNPHVGDNGLIGNEDLNIIGPVIANFFDCGNLVYGPYSADSFFGTGNYKNFDAVLGMYHDQALIPFKLMSFGRGVNYTAGLPIIRVSPDHGVGYDIVTQNIAHTSSVLASIFLGIKLYYNRKRYFATSRKNHST